MEFGIMQPYLTLSYDGNFMLRNDNPSNIVDKPINVETASESDC